jgi:Xaa-Pro aminopeptidase
MRLETDRSMFQTFEVTGDPSVTTERVAKLRRLMARARIDAILVPRSDAHQGEYVAPESERLKWLSNFSGSAGLAIITADSAVLFVDGRYTTQAANQVATEIFTVSQISDTYEHAIIDWLKARATAIASLGFDPWLHTIDAIETVRHALGKSGPKLKATARNLVDVAWGTERPSPQTTPIMLHDQRYAGAPTATKIARLQAQLSEAGDGTLLMTQPDNISWLFNIRGKDVPHTPVVLAFALIPAEGKAELFLEPLKLPAGVRKTLEKSATLHPPELLQARLIEAAANARPLRVDPRSTSYWFHRAVGAAARKLHRAADPVTRTKAIKNEIELQGTRAAHLRDGIAMCRFLAWLDRTIATAPVDEITAVKTIERIRRETGALMDISFDTISGSGANGAIVHYRVSAGSNRQLLPGEVFLLDSGGQYRDGTTDITRTIAIGEVKREIRHRFTLVLKGHIAIASCRFPTGTRGIDIDAFARRALWSAGLDYDHGTGHGVGSFLSVHEGPQSISRRGISPLEAGMICSNEPGYYKPGEYGIRIENLCVVRPAAPIDGGDRPMHSFETLTLAPIELRLVEPAALAPHEIAWLNDYHANVFQCVSPTLDPADHAWLKAATRALPKS